MKKKYLLGLIPAVLLSSCIGPNWQVDIERAVKVTKGIIAKQDADGFKVPENFRYYTETFNLTRKPNSTYSERNTYTFDIDIVRFFFRYEFTKTAHEESEAAKQDQTTIQWYFYDAANRKIYEVYNGGTLESRTYKVTELEEEETFDDKKFHDHIVEILSGKDQFDYKGQEYIDPLKVQENVNDVSKQEGITNQVKFFSRYDHSFSYEIETKFDSYVDGDGYVITGNSRESYGWENYYYCSHSFTQDVTAVRGNENIQSVDNISYGLTIFNNKTSVEFDYPDLTKYKEIVEVPPEENGEK